MGNQSAKKNEMNHIMLEYIKEQHNEIELENLRKVISEKEGVQKKLEQKTEELSEELKKVVIEKEDIQKELEQKSEELREVISEKEELTNELEFQNSPQKEQLKLQICSLREVFERLIENSATLYGEDSDILKNKYSESLVTLQEKQERLDEITPWILFLKGLIGLVAALLMAICRLRVLAEKIHCSRTCEKLGEKIEIVIVAEEDMNPPANLNLMAKSYMYLLRQCIRREHYKYDRMADSYKNELSQKTEENVDLENQLEVSRKKLKNWEEKFARDIKEKEEKFKEEMRVQEENFTKEKEKLDEQIVFLDQEIQEKTDEINRRQAEIGEYKESLEKKEAKIEGLNNEIAKLGQEIKEKTNKINIQQGEINICRKSLQQKENEIESMSEEIKTLGNEMERLKTTAKKWKMSLVIIVIALIIVIVAMAA